MVEVSEKPKHKPSAKHTLEEVRKSLEDLVRNQFDEAPAPASSQEQEATENEAEASTALSSPRHGRRRHGLGLDTQSLLQSLRGLIGDELGGATVPPAEAATTQEAAPSPDPQATAPAATEGAIESVPDSEEITLEASGPGDTLGEDLTEAVDLDSELPWSTRPRAAQAADRGPEKAAQDSTLDRRGAARGAAAPAHQGAQSRTPTASIRIVDLLRADGSPTAFAARDPALSSSPKQGDTARGTERLAASQPELWTYAVVTAPWPTEANREPSNDKASAPETQAANALAEEPEELTLEALPDPKASTSRDALSVEEELSLEGALSLPPDEAPSLSHPVPTERRNEPAENFALAEESALAVDAPAKQEQPNSDGQEKKNAPVVTAATHSRLDLLEIPGEETALEVVEPEIGGRGDEGSPPVTPAAQEEVNIEVRAEPRKEESPPPAAPAAPRDEEDVDLSTLSEAQLMPEIPHERKPAETAPKTSVSNKQAAQEKPAQEKRESPKAKRTSATPGPPAAKTHPPKPLVPRSFVPPSDPAGIFGKIPKLEFQPGAAQRPGDERKKLEVKPRQAGQRRSPSVADVKPKPQDSAPFSPSLFEEPPKAPDKGSGVAYMPSRPEKKAGDAPPLKTRPSGDTGKAAPTPRMARPSPPVAAPRAQKPPPPKAGGAQPWPGSKLPRPALKPTKAEAPEKRLTAVPVLKAVVEERSTSHSLQKPAARKDAPARAPESGAVLKPPSAKLAPAKLAAAKPAPAKPAAGDNTDPRALAVQIIAKLNVELRKSGERVLNPAIISRLQYLLRDALTTSRATGAKPERDKR